MAKRTKRNVSVPKPVKAWLCGQLEPGDPIICGVGNKAYARFVLCNGANDVHPVIIADARHYRVVRKPLPRKRGGR